MIPESYTFMSSMNEKNHATKIKCFENMDAHCAVIIK